MKDLLQDLSSLLDESKTSPSARHMEQGLTTKVNASRAKLQTQTIMLELMQRFSPPTPNKTQNRVFSSVENRRSFATLKRGKGTAIKIVKCSNE